MIKTGRSNWEWAVDAKIQPAFKDNVACAIEPEQANSMASNSFTIKLIL